MLTHYGLPLFVDQLVACLLGILAVNLPQEQLSLFRLVFLSFFFLFFEAPFVMCNNYLFFPLRNKNVDTELGFALQKIYKKLPLSSIRSFSNQLVNLIQQIFQTTASNELKVWLYIYVCIV